MITERLRRDWQAGFLFFFKYHNHLPALQRQGARCSPAVFSCIGRRHPDVDAVLRASLSLLSAAVLTPTECFEGGSAGSPWRS